MTRLRGLLLSLIVALVFASCAGETWSFPLSRQAYPDLFGRSTDSLPRAGYRCPPSALPETWGGGSGEGAAIVLAAIIVAPVAIDIAILPITGVHDLFFTP